MSNHNLNLLESLKENNSILVKQDATDWKQAINVCINPLVKANAVKDSYISEIIDNVAKNGPYFIIADYVAMPHAQGSGVVSKNCFSLVTLKNPIYFETDNRPVSILIGLASNDPNVHVGVALPQIVAVFEDENNINLIRNANSVTEIIDIISKVNLNKYL